MKNRNIFLAVFFNFFVPGLGYIYLGKKKIFASMLIVIIILAAIDRYFLNVIAAKSYSWLGIVISLLFSFAFAFDAYCEAKSLNKNSIVMKRR